MKKNILIIVLLMISMSSISQTPDTLFQRGVNEYQSNNFAAAVENFKQLYDMNYRHFEVCYNLGNSYFKTNDMPSAILYYERAKRLKPNDLDVVANIQVANNRIVDNIESIPEMFYTKWWNGFKQIFTPQEWSIISIVLFAMLLCGLLLIFVLRQLRARKHAFWFSFVVVILFTLSIMVCVSIRKDFTRSDEAIAMTATITAKGSPTDSSIDLFVIHRGTKVEITDSISEWIEIRLSNGKVGWIKSADVVVI